MFSNVIKHLTVYGIPHFKYRKKNFASYYPKKFRIPSFSYGRETLFVLKTSFATKNNFLKPWWSFFVLQLKLIAENRFLLVLIRVLRLLLKIS